MDKNLLKILNYKSYILVDSIPCLMPKKQNNDYEKVKKANIQYYNKIASFYEEEPEQAELQNNFNQRRIQKIIKRLSEKTEANYFLDIGCGTGNLLKFGQKYFKNTVGIDVSLNMLKIAKERGYSVIQADAAHLPFKSGVFDVISTFSVLHHLYDYSLLIKEATRTLKPGGFLYTDWDPQKRPKIDENKISWQIFKFIRNLYKKTKPSPEKKYSNVQKLAEYHNLYKQGEERGISFDQLKEILIKNNFINIQPTFHWAGKSLNQLPLSLKIRFWFLKFQDYPLERFMENIMIIAQKK